MKNLNYFILLTVLLIVINCNKNKNPVNSENIKFIYPIKIGYQWEYSRTFSKFNFRTDTITIHPLKDTSITSISTIRVLKHETILDSINSYVFQETLTQGNQINIDYSYYDNLNTGMYFYAYHGEGFLIPKNTPRKNILFKGKYFNSIRDITSYIIKSNPDNYILEDSLIYEIPPLQCLKYPIKISDQWIYRFPGKPWHINKRIINIEKLEVPAGKFDCYKIQWLHDIDNNGTWDEDIVFYDYICDKGLIKRSIIFKDVVWRGEQVPEPIVLFDSKDEAILTKINF